jgi:hypothetical protein
MSSLAAHFEIVLRLEIECRERRGSKFLQRLLSHQKKEPPE